MNLRAAVIGAGFVGRAHIEALRRLGIPIQGVLGSSPARTEKACHSLGMARAYRSLDELVGDESVDVVHICTPNHLHFPEAESALRAGKHVMCEKPLAMNTQETKTLLQLARERGRVGAVTYNLRYYPLCQEAHALVRQGRIGEPRIVHGAYLQDWLFYPTDWNWRLDPELGGRLRAVADIGTHWLDLVGWITGRNLTELCADLATVIPVRQRPIGSVETFQKTADRATQAVAMTTDDYASILLRFEGNLRGVLTVSQVSAGRKNRMWVEIDGSEGSLAWDEEQPNVLWIGSRNQANRFLIKDPSLMSPEARGYAAYPAGHAEGYPDTFVRLFHDLYGYIAAANFQAQRSFPTFETGHHEVKLCELIALSAEQRRWVAVADGRPAAPARKARASAARKERKP
ncbi:MAG TPA: Gfo/Idh/MocA family oxidoreductase [Terriglobales bacterium]|nr:Gfo/Idh/MocA family oxidoreductase [Terriglobales bacterium]